MDAPFPSAKPPFSGTVEITDIPEELRTRDKAYRDCSQVLLYTWRPPDRLKKDLPSWYCISLVCALHKSGMRIFFPATKAVAAAFPENVGLQYVAQPASLVLVSSVGGHVILTNQEEIREDLLALEEMRLFNQYVRHMQEHWGRTTKLGRLLEVCAGGRVDSGTKDILPEDLGLDSQGAGERWSPYRLKDEGLRAAKSDGLENPTPDEILRYGLRAAAIRKPIDVEDWEASSLVRMALFDLGSSTDKIETEDLEYVAKQVRASLKDHLHDTPEAFDRWIEDPKSNLIHRIAKRRDCSLDRRQVRKALLELGWQTLHRLGRCMDAQMKAFRDALPVPLSPDENRFYASAYLAQPQFGGLPLLFLHDRFDFLHEALVAAWNEPDDRQRIAIVHTMMYYFAVIAGNRRAADRCYKKRANHRAATGHVAREESQHIELAARAEPSPHEGFKEVTRLLAMERGIDCNFGDDEWHAKLTSVPHDSVATIHICCPKRKFDETLYVPRAEFEHVARSVIEEPGRKEGGAG